MKHRDIKSTVIPSFHASESCEKLGSRNNGLKRQSRNHLFLWPHLDYSPRHPHQHPLENYPSQAILSKWSYLPPGHKFQIFNSTLLRSLGVCAISAGGIWCPWCRPNSSHPDVFHIIHFPTQPWKYSHWEFPQAQWNLGVFVPASGNTSTCQF